jgi:hypothetical protein
MFAATSHPNLSIKRRRHKRDSRQARASKSLAASAAAVPDRGTRYPHGDPLYAGFR